MPVRGNSYSPNFSGKKLLDLKHHIYDKRYNIIYAVFSQHIIEMLRYWKSAHNLFHMFMNHVIIR